MEHNHDHHEETKPSNKWVATPIIMAFLVIAALVTFLNFATGKCCGGECKAKTEEHGGEHNTHGTTNEHGTTTNEHSEEATADTTKTTSDTTATENHEGHGDGHEEGHGDGHGH